MGRLLDGSLSRLLFVVRLEHADNLRSMALMPAEDCGIRCLACLVEGWLFALAWSEWRGHELHLPRAIRSWAWARLERS